MSNFVNDVKFASTTFGFNDFGIGAAVSGFQLPTAAAGFLSGTVYSYSARTTLGQFESGIGVCNGTTIARTTVIDGSNGPGALVNFAIPPTVVITALSGDFVIRLATANISLFVSTTGSDGNLGTAASPFLTIQKALDVAGSYDYGHIFTCTINVADGIYPTASLAPAAFLPKLINYPTYGFGTGPQLLGNLTTPTNISVRNTLGDVVVSGPGSIWIVKGFQLKSTSGSGSDLIAQQGGYIIIDRIDFAGNFNNAVAFQYSTINATSASLTISSPAAFRGFYCFFYGNIILDGPAITTWTVGTAYSGYVAQIADYGILGEGSFVNGNTVTGNRCFITNNGMNEVTLTRANFPGDGRFDIGFGENTYFGDNEFIVYAAANGGNVALDPGVKDVVINNGSTIATLTITLPQQKLIGCTINKLQNIRIRFANSITTLTIAPHAGDAPLLINMPTGVSGGQEITIGFDSLNNRWVGEFDSLFFDGTTGNANVNANSLVINSVNTVLSGNFAQNTSTGLPITWGLIVPGSAIGGNFAGIYDNSNAVLPFAVSLAWTQIVRGSVYGFNASTTLALGAPDTGISSPATGVLALGNGTNGDASATIKAKTKAGAVVAGDLPVGTWALIRDTAGATQKLYYNDAGTLRSVALV